jgi:hypothetical protein
MNGLGEELLAEGGEELRLHENVKARLAEESRL